MTSVVHDILNALVRQWGFEHVSKCLDEAQQEGTAARHRGREPSRHLRPSAYDLTTKLSVEEPKKVLLIEIAKRFDDKTFLPRLGDVRHFLEMKGEKPKIIKQRPDAFRAILMILQEMPADAIERVLKDRSNSGPARLGPLSRAINQAAAVRSNDQPSIHEKDERIITDVSS